MSFKGVFLEGLEIVFIVITFGLNADNVPLAAAGAAAAGAIVLAIGAAAHRPLASVPQNTIKFAVGLLLTTFGTFWAVEGLGWFSESGESLAWPGGDVALLILLAAWAAFSWSAIRVLEARDRVRGFFRFWRDFIVGDDWRIAVGVTVVLAVGPFSSPRTRSATPCCAAGGPRHPRRGRNQPTSTFSRPLDTCFIS